MVEKRRYERERTIRLRKGYKSDMDRMMIFFVWNKCATAVIYMRYNDYALYIPIKIMEVGERERKPRKENRI